MTRLPLACAALLVTSLMLVEPAQAARRAPLYEPGQTQIVTLDGKTLGVDKVRSTLLLGARQTGWMVVQESGTQLLLRFDKGQKHSATVKVSYDDKGYTLSYVDSYNLNYRVDEQGVQIHPAYNEWVNRLIRSIGATALRP